jgi:hypothetical protein
MVIRAKALTSDNSVSSDSDDSADARAAEPCDRTEFIEAGFFESPPASPSIVVKEEPQMRR